MCPRVSLQSIAVHASPSLSLVPSLVTVLLFSESKGFFVCGVQGLGPSVVPVGVKLGFTLCKANDITPILSHQASESQGLCMCCLFCWRLSVIRRSRFSAPWFSTKWVSGLSSWLKDYGAAGNTGRTLPR